MAAALSSRTLARRLAQHLPAPLLSRLRTLDKSVELRSRALTLLTTDSAAALRAYRHLTELDASHPMHWIGLGLAQVSMSQMNAAAHSADQAMERVKGNAPAYFVLAQLQRQLGTDEAAAESATRGLAEAVAAGSNDPGLRKAASEYAERRGDDLQVEALLMPLVQERGGESDVWARLLTALIRLRGDEVTRQVVGKAVRSSGEWLPLHALMLTYAALGDHRRARLLNRWLMRVWPHSEHHRRRYIDALIEVGRGDLADAMIRQAYEADKSVDRERDYCERALKGSEFAEARRRYAWFIRRHPGDTGAYLRLGYALANVEGVDAAERHFAAAAASIDCYDALVAMAHMAMRRRDGALTAERWAAVKRTYPEDGQAVVEQARALFASGDVEAAIRLSSHAAGGELSQHRLAEFRVWLLNVTGQFDLARTEALELNRRFGPNWTAAEVSIQTGGLRGELEAELPGIVARLPQVHTELDVRHTYALLKLLDHFGHVHEGLRRLLPRVGRTMRLDWAWGYLAHDPELDGIPETIRLAARQDHAELGAIVTDDVFTALEGLSPADLSDLLSPRARAHREIHIINMFEQASGGSELHALDLGALLSDHAHVRFWSPEFPHPTLHAEHGVNAIDVSADAFPRRGVLVFIGVYFALGPWLAQARPERILVLYNTFDAVRLSTFVRTLHRFTGLKVELLFCSDLMKREAALPGLFEPSPIELPPPSACVRPRPDSFVIGRHSRDVVEKHGPTDATVYTALIARGAHVRLLGATCMGKLFPPLAQLELLPARRGGVTEFLQGLDVFFYRTGTWIEPWGRVVLEAMALGLPVVVHRRGGYAEAIEHGVDGFLFTTDAEAIEWLDALRLDRDLRRRIGNAARRKAEALVGPAALQRLVAVYLSPATRDVAGRHGSAPVALDDQRACAAMSSEAA